MGFSMIRFMCNTGIVKIACVGLLLKIEITQSVWAVRNECVELLLGLEITRKVWVVRNECMGVTPRAGDHTKI
jgi:hypothetical protein